MVYSWIAVCFVTLAVAYSFAEMCSAYPVAGGQYSWVAVLAPPRYARGLSWVTGWFMITGVVSMGAVNNFITANFLLGMANLANPDYVIQRWHTVLVCYLITICAAVMNIFGQKLLNRISKGILVWNIVSFFVVIITMLATNDHKQPASFVFKVSLPNKVSIQPFFPSFKMTDLCLQSEGLSKHHRFQRGDGHHCRTPPDIFRYELIPEENTPQKPLFSIQNFSTC